MCVCVSLQCLVSLSLVFVAGVSLFLSYPEKAEEPCYVLPTHLLTSENIWDQSTGQ